MVGRSLVVCQGCAIASRPANIQFYRLLGQTLRGKMCNAKGDSIVCHGRGIRCQQRQGAMLAAIAKGFVNLLNIIHRGGVVKMLKYRTLQSELCASLCSRILTKNKYE